MEKWEPIPQFDDLYEVSNKGRIRSRNGRIMKIQTHPNGYKVISLMGTSHLIHRLVAENFLPNPYGLDEVVHIDADKTNNDVGNLRWSTRKKKITVEDRERNLYSFKTQRELGDFLYLSEHQVSRLMRNNGKRFVYGRYIISVGKLDER